MDSPLMLLAGVVVLGVGAQWLAWRLRLPSILLLLVLGVVAGPVTGFLDPDALLGQALQPFVSLAVALILFEGGLSLRFSEVRTVRGPLLGLISVGVLVTWIIVGLAGHYLLGLPANVAGLLGAILTVSGPTVVGPLLRVVRPRGRVGSLVKWEGILNDPVGALLAVLVYEVVIGHAEGATGHIALGLVKTAVAGSILGWLGGRTALWIFRRGYAPDALQSPITLMLVFVVSLAADAIQHEAGLLAVTLMGVTMANQRSVHVRHVIEFKENLRVLLISSLFVLLAARVRPDQLAQIDWRLGAFLVVMIVVARPLAVALATLGSDLSRAERLFLMAVAPRGIVAAAVSSVFALRLEEAGVPGGAALAPITFFAIIGTVTFYGLAAGPIARRLGMARPAPQGLLFVGASPWAREMAGALQAEDVHVHMIDSNRPAVRAARMAGLPATCGDVLSERVVERLDLDDIRHCLAVTPNDDLNALAALHFAEHLERVNVYQLSDEIEDVVDDVEPLAGEARARPLFHPRASFHDIADRVALGARVRRTKITAEFGLDELRAHYGESAWPLFAVQPAGSVVVATADRPLSVSPGDVLIGLVDDPDAPHEESDEPARAETPALPG